MFQNDSVHLFPMIWKDYKYFQVCLGLHQSNIIILCVWVSNCLRDCLQTTTYNLYALKFQGTASEMLRSHCSV
uniref:Uncharacterized protein n=1 Tax=Podarcis muralis TaxID=64176 RepID=A0A670IX85_PODMU